MKKKTLILFISLLFSLPAAAINLQKFHFSNSPIFATLEDGILSNGFITTDHKYILVGSYNYVDDPFISVVDDRRDSTIIDWMQTVNLGGAYKFTPKFQVGLSTFFTYERATPVGSVISQKKLVRGDATIDFKYKFYEKRRLAIALTPRIYFPNGDKDFYTSNSKIGYYVGFVVDKAFRKFQVAMNLGHKENKGAEYLSVDHRRQFHFSLGALIPLYGNYDLTAEFFRDTPYSSTNDHAPSEANVGIRYNYSRVGALFAGVGTGSLSDDNSTDLRAYVGFKYYPKNREKQKTRPKRIIKEEKKYGNFYKLYNIYFATASYSLSKVEKAKLEEMVQNIRDDAYISRIVVEGYASKVGSFELNKKLSKKRALRVIKYILNRGVNKDLIKYVSFGNSKADEFNQNNDEDRKVMFRIYRNR